MQTLVLVHSFGFLKKKKEKLKYARITVVSPRIPFAHGSFRLYSPFAQVVSLLYFLVNVNIQ